MKKLLLTIFTLLCLCPLLVSCASKDSKLESDVKTDATVNENLSIASEQKLSTISPATTVEILDTELEILSDTISKSSTGVSTDVIDDPYLLDKGDELYPLDKGQEFQAADKDKDVDTGVVEDDGEDEKAKAKEDTTIFVSFDQEVSTDSVANYTLDTQELYFDAASETSDNDTITLTLEASDLSPYEEEYIDSSEITYASYLKSDGTDYNFDKTLHIIETDYDGDLSIFKDFENLYELILHERVNLSGIENCPRIKKLYLQMDPYANLDENDALFKVLIVKLEDISHIKELTISGYLDGNYVKFVDSENPVELKSLDLYRSYFRNINAFNKTADLYFLTLQNCSIDKPFILKSFKNMRSIQCNGMAVERNKFISNFDESFVEGLTSLTYLHWENTNIGTARGLGELKNLTRLQLSGFSFDNYDVIASNPKLDTFHIENSKINSLIFRDSEHLRSIDISNLSLSALRYRNNKHVKEINIEKSIIEKTTGYDEMSPFLNISNVDFQETDKAIIKEEIKGMTIDNMQFDFSMFYDQVKKILEENNLTSDKIEITNDTSDWDYGHSIIENENFNLYFNTYNQLYKITINTDIENSRGDYISSSIGSIISDQGDDYKRYSGTNESESIYDYYYGESSLYFIVKSGRVKGFGISMYHYNGILNE